MNGTLDGIVAAVDALRRAGGDRGPVGLSPGELMGVNEAFGALRRVVDAAYAPVAAEIARQSRPELGKDSLARKQGYRTPARLISATTGASVSDAIKLVTVGEATAPGASLTGEALPARHPHVAEALTAGRIGVWAGAEITRMLDHLPPRVDPAAVAAMEQTLVDAAPGLTSDELQRLLIRAEAILDPDGVEAKEQHLREERFLMIREDRFGAILFHGKFDPETGAPVKTALEGIVGGMLRRRDRDAAVTGVGAGSGGLAGGAGAADAGSDSGGHEVGNADSGGEPRTGHGDTGHATTGHANTGHGDLVDGDPVDSDTVEGDQADANPGPGDTADGDAVDGDVLVDPRSVRQMYADALAEVCRHAIGCEQTPTGPSTTIIVRMDLTDLEDGVGVGMIDGITQPVSAATVRRMAADGQVIPVVLGGDSEILDWGRAKRLFTPAQKLATIERDGGCACCGLPPAMTVVHHLNWWARDGGRTDLDNAIALCVACHHRIHDDGWDIRITGAGTRAKVWFLPPPWIDPARTPRLGGRTRFDLTA